MPRKKTHEEFVKEVYDLVGDEYIILGEYINTETPILIKHNKCNNKYYKKPHKFLQGDRCPNCKFEKIKKLKVKTTEQFKKEVYNLVGDEYSILGEYINNKTHIQMKHNKCGYIWNTNPHNFLLNKSRCPKCSGLMKKTTEQFKKEVYELVGNEYTILGKYINNHTAIEIQHNKCNTIWKSRPDCFLLNKSKCPYCKESKGEKRIANYLDKMSVSYKKEYSFKDLYYKDKNHPLRFDFRIYCKNENIILIEYDGEFHFKEIFYNDFSLKEQQLRDKMKDDYVMSHNNIYLYRIDYTEFDKIEECIDEILNENKNIIFQK